MPAASNTWDRLRDSDPLLKGKNVRSLPGSAAPPQQVARGSLLCPPQSRLSHERQQIWPILALAVVPTCGLAGSPPVSGLG